MTRASMTTPSIFGCLSARAPVGRLRIVSATIWAKSELQPTFLSDDLRSLVAQAPMLQIHTRILATLV